MIRRAFSGQQRQHPSSPLASWRLYGTPPPWIKPKVQRRRSPKGSQSLPATMTVSTTTTSSSSSTAAWRRKAEKEDLLATLPALRCPGGPRVKAEGLKSLYKVPHAGYLAKYDQRFILNLKLTHQIVSYLARHTLKESEGKLVVELGPGAGSLTRSLLTRPGLRVIAIEKDERFSPLLQQIQNYTEGQFRWCCADVLQVNELDIIRRFHPQFVQQHARQPSEKKSGSGSSYGERRQRYAQDHAEAQAARAQFNTSPNPALDIADHAWADGGARLEVVANLPFAIISELVIRYCVDCANKENIFVFGRVPVHVFTQAEVAQRLTAPPGSLSYSRLSVLVQCYFHVRYKQSFSEYTYYPRTEVLGSFLTLEPRAVPLIRGISGAALAHFLGQLMPTDYISADASDSAAAAEGVEEGGDEDDEEDGSEWGSMEPMTSGRRHAEESTVNASGGRRRRSARRGVSRGSTVHKALSRFLPAEVVQYMLQESNMDGALSVLDLQVDEVGRLAILWKQFLDTSNQNTD